MKLRSSLPPLLALLLGLACAPKEPSFVYDVPPGPALAALGTVALDPRQQVWKLDGQYSADPWEFRQPVLEELRGKGYRFVPSGEAELWLDLIAFRPQQGGGGAPRETGPQATGKGHRGGGQNGNQGPGPGGAPGGRMGAEGAASRPTGEVTLIVRLVSSRDEKVLWFASVAVPPGKPGPGTVPPEVLIHRLLGPLPIRTSVAGKPDAGVVN